MKPNEDWNQGGQNQNFGAPNNYPQNPYPPQQNYGGFSNNFDQNGQLPSNQFPNEQFLSGQNPQQQFGGQNQNFGAQQNFPQYPNNYQNQQQFPAQPNQTVQNLQAAPNLMPDQIIRKILQLRILTQLSISIRLHLKKTLRFGLRAKF